MEESRKQTIKNVSEKNASLLGKWKSNKADNFEKYMKELDINPIHRKLGLLTTIHLQYEFSDDMWIVSWRIATRNGKLKFKSGDEVPTVMPDERKVVVRASIEDGKHFEYQRGSPRDCTVERWVDEHGRLQERSKIVGKNIIYQRFYERDS